MSKNRAGSAAAVSMNNKKNINMVVGGRGGRGGISLATNNPTMTSLLKQQASFAFILNFDALYNEQQRETASSVTLTSLYDFQFIMLLYNYANLCSKLNIVGIVKLARQNENYYYSLYFNLFSCFPFA